MTGHMWIGIGLNWVKVLEGWNSSNKSGQLHSWFRSIAMCNFVGCYMLTAKAKVLDYSVESGLSRKNCGSRNFF
jgi:hypothetical protein